MWSRISGIFEKQDQRFPVFRIISDSSGPGGGDVGRPQLSLLCFLIISDTNLAEFLDRSESSDSPRNASEKPSIAKSTKSGFSGDKSYSSEISRSVCIDF